jgi:hypothetical protein
MKINDLDSFINKLNSDIQDVFNEIYQETQKEHLLHDKIIYSKSFDIDFNHRTIVYSIIHSFYISSPLDDSDYGVELNISVQRTPFDSLDDITFEQKLSENKIYIWCDIYTLGEDIRGQVEDKIFELNVSDLPVVGDEVLNSIEIFFLKNITNIVSKELMIMNYVNSLNY